MASYRSLVELANNISKDAALFDSYCTSKGFPSPSLDPNAAAPDHISDLNVRAARERLIHNARELQHTALGPFNSWRTLQNQSDLDILGIVFITRFGIPARVPLDGDISFEELSRGCGIPLPALKRLLRYTMTNFVFLEPREGFVSHTASSNLLRENPVAHTLANINADESFPASAKVIKALSKYPAMDEPWQSGWGIENNATQDLFAELAANHPERSKRFAGLMSAFATTVPVEFVVTKVDWPSFGSAKVVDVGGAYGPVSIALAKAHPNLTFVVQDLGLTVKDGQELLPKELRHRFQFMEHDFFTPQPVQGDVYFFRAIFHNWPEKYCVKILQALIPAMRNGTRIVINDPFLPAPKDAVSPWRNRQSLANTLRMLVYFNSHDRDEHEWKEIFAQADKRFKIERFQKPSELGLTEHMMCIIEVVWEG